MNALDHRLRVDMRRQRQLHQDAVDGRIDVQGIDQRQHLLLRGRTGQVVRDAGDAGTLARPLLVAHIHRRGRIVADQDDCQAGTAFALRLAFGHLVVDHCEDGVGHGLAVENSCAHQEHPEAKQ